jgi:hypothetical protein
VGVLEAINVKKKGFAMRFGVEESVGKWTEMGIERKIAESRITDGLEVGVIVGKSVTETEAMESAAKETGKTELGNHSHWSKVWKKFVPLGRDQLLGKDRGLPSWGLLNKHTRGQPHRPEGD